MADTRIQHALETILEEDSGVSAIVSSRVYPLLRSTGSALPAITYQKIDGPRLQSHDGPSGTAHPRFQVNIWAKKYTEVVTLAERVRIALDGYSGTVGTVVIQAITLEDEADAMEAEDVEEMKMYGIRQDYFVWHEEPQT